MQLNHYWPGRFDPRLLSCNAPAYTWRTIETFLHHQVNICIKESLWISIMYNNSIIFNWIIHIVLYRSFFEKWTTTRQLVNNNKYYSSRGRPLDPMHWDICYQCWWGRSGARIRIAAAHQRLSQKVRHFFVNDESDGRGRSNSQKARNQPFVESFRPFMPIKMPI